LRERSGGQRYAANVVLESIGLKVLDQVRGVHQQRRRVRVRVHLAFFTGGRVPYRFVNVVNLSRGREVEVTHVWFDVEPRVDVLLTERLLPVRLRADESWEAWIEATKVGNVRNPETRARVRLSSGRVIKSRRNRDVPPIGFVPGGATPVASGAVRDTGNPFSGSS